MRHSVSLHRSLSALKRFAAPLQLPLIGMSLGLAYGIAERLLDLHRQGQARMLIRFHNILEYLLPVTLGATVGLLINYVRRQDRLNRSLSAQNTRLQRQFLTQTLSAHILHEIRTPLHNLTALIEDRKRGFTQNETAMLQRNLDRLRLVADQLSRWDALDALLDAHESTPLRPWFAGFLSDKIGPQLQGLDIAIEHRLERVSVRMHPLLLEQCLVTLFNNAVEAASRGRPPHSIVFSARMSPECAGHVEVDICNTGELYPETVLTAQGDKPIASKYGLGLGLVLVRRALEQVGGSLQLANKNSQACTRMLVPGQYQ